MKAGNRNAKDLFEKQVRYVIPDFQRPYVWNVEDQWEPFWEDVQYAAERFIEELDVAGGDALAAEQQAGHHFLGAIVTKQVVTGATGIETHEVIDGQQRMTTLQILLDAVQEVAEDQEWEDISEELSDLVLNKKRYAKENPDHIFKVWPTPSDQDAFRATMANGRSVADHKGSRIVEAHAFFQGRIRDWVLAGDEGVDGAERRANALQIALLGLLELIVIDLGDADDPYVIFETLNARGTPLLASDLVKNYLLRVAETPSTSASEVAAEYWDHFGQDFWRKEIRQGRLRRPRIDTFLDYWLEVEVEDEVASHEVFPTFKKLVDGDRTILEVASSLKGYSEVYRHIEEVDPYSREGTFFYRWDEIDARVLTPLLLWVFRQPTDALTAERRERLLVALESYLVRRMVCRMTTKQYNRMFLEALKRLKAAGPESADDTLIEYLAGQTSESQIWPSDAALRTAMLDSPVYSLLARKRVRIVLEAIEDDFRDAKSEDQFVVRNKLEVEHVLPQSWSVHWPLPPGTDPLQGQLDRDRLKHTFGNLTLATSSLNKTMSHHDWPTKRKHLEDNSTLHLNKRIIDLARDLDGWGEDAIRARSEALFERAVKVWPRP